MVWSPTQNASGKEEPPGWCMWPRTGTCCKCGQTKVVWKDDGIRTYEGVQESLNPKCEDCCKE